MGQKQTIPSRAIAVMNMNEVKGVVCFSQQPKGLIRITVQLEGVPPGKHGMHIHQFGDISGTACAATGPHYNPRGSTHGGPPRSSERHPGDFGNLRADSSGMVKSDFSIRGLRLEDVVGRSIVLHSGEDDLGTGTGARREESLKTGNSGRRLACAVIGLAAFLQ